MNKNLQKDNQSEQIVQDALDKAQQGRTCIVIAHRLFWILKQKIEKVVNKIVILILSD